MELTIGQLIDALITESQKCWHAIDRMHELDKPVESMTREELEILGKASLEAHRANGARVKLVHQIDQKINNSIENGSTDIFIDIKSYE